jgi:hypothetical protein
MHKRLNNPCVPQHANLDGRDVKTIASNLIRHPFSLVIFQVYLPNHLQKQSYLHLFIRNDSNRILSLLTET